MSPGPVFIAAVGIVSPLGQGREETLRSLVEERSGIRPLDLFDPGQGQAALPVGQVDWPETGDRLPRTHRLALAAARQAMAGREEPPDAVVLGTTTGGMLATEGLLKAGVTDAGAYAWHSPGSVTALLAREVGCRGPALTVSTACSSGAAAIALGARMIRAGLARRVLAGGADSLCRLTYHGFKALKIVDPAGARPFDRDRAGMSVGEGAAFLLLAAENDSGAAPMAQLRGCGLSCDAYHPAAPHPRGRGAFEAMAAALEDAGLGPEAVDAVSLHGTGTRDNDASEALALRRLFGRRMPLLSAIKGATGHGLAASGAIEAAVAALALSEQLVPGTFGWRRPDPGLGLRPEARARRFPVGTVLSDSLGFGGSNAALVIAAPEPSELPGPTRRRTPLTVLSWACFTGAGFTQETLAGLERGAACGGVHPVKAPDPGRTAGAARRLRRLPRMALALAAEARGRPGAPLPVGSVFFGTGHGALSETHRFLSLLFETGERFASPTDFIGSVHNAPAGAVARHAGATGANLTLTGGETAFEQALLAAGLLAGTGEGALLVMGADEYHPVLSALFDPAAAAGDPPADGGGALCLSAAKKTRGPGIEVVFLGTAEGGEAPVRDLVSALGGTGAVAEGFGAVLAGIPGGLRSAASERLQWFLHITGFSGPVVDYRRYTGQFATASAVAAAAAAGWVASGRVPAALCAGRAAALDGRGILLLGLGDTLSAVALGCAR